MSDIHAALRSLYDSLNALFTRMDSTDALSLRVARIMLRIGEIEQSPAPSDDDGSIETSIHRFAGSVSMSDPAASDTLRALLSDLDGFLAAMVPG